MCLDTLVPSYKGSSPDLNYSLPTRGSFTTWIKDLLTKAAWIEELIKVVVSSVSPTPSEDWPAICVCACRGPLSSPSCTWLHFTPALCFFFFFFPAQNSHWALMINKTLPTMRGTQSALVLAESEKDRDNYSLNRQSPRWRPHNQAWMCILGSFHRNAGRKLC